jgi:biotin carboxyl carrier protein
VPGPPVALGAIRAGRMSPTAGDPGFEAIPSPSAVRITIDGDPAIVIVVDPAAVASGPSSAAGPEPLAPSAEPGPPAPRDPPVPATDPTSPAVIPLSPRPPRAPGDVPGRHDAPSASPGRPLVRPIPPSRDQAPGSERLEIVVDGWRFEAVVESARRAMLRDLARRERGAGREGPQVVRAPLPGRIVRVWVSAGDTVEAGAPLCSLDAMKMENEIRAARAGTIERVSVAPGAHVEHGDELVVIG